VRLPSPSESSTRRVALSWLLALPPRRASGLGVFPSWSTPGTLGSGRFSRGVRLLFRVLPLPSRPRTVPFHDRRSDHEPSGNAGSASPGFLAPSNATTPGAPFATTAPRRVRGVRGVPAPRRCRPQGSCPSRRFWLRHGTYEPLAEPAALRVAPTLRGLVPCRSRPWSRPSELSRFRGAVPALAGPCFHAGSRSATAGATCASDSRPLSPPRRPLASACP